MAVNSMGEVARALRSIGPDIPIDQQINTVSNALVGTQKIREETHPEGKGLPKDASNLLENLKSRLNQISTTLLEIGPEPDELAQWLRDIETIQKFVVQVVDHYNAAGEELPREVIQELKKAAAEVNASCSLKQIKLKMIAIKSQYRANPEMPKESYRDQLHDISHVIKQWGEEYLPSDPYLRESIVIRKQLAELKRQLDEGYALLELEGHPGIVGDVALNLLRVASGMIQQAKNQFELKQALGMAEEASRNLGKSGKELIEQGRPFRLLIRQSVMLFVNKQLKKMEKELHLPLYFVPGDVDGGRDISERMLINKERLLTYYDFAVSWSGPQQTELLERMALIFEQITDRASKAKIFTLEEVSKKKNEDPQLAELVKLSASFYTAEVRGKASIKPDAIFGVADDPARDCQRLLEQLPDPTLSGSSSLFMEKLGRLYTQAKCLEAKTSQVPEIEEKVLLAFARIKDHLSQLPQNLDIQVEEKANQEYFPLVWKQVRERFFQNLGVSKKVLQNLPQADHLEVMDTYRILSHFLEGHYGEMQKIPLVMDVKRRFWNEVDGHTAKLFLTCVHQLALPLPASESQVETLLESKNGELRRFFEVWKERDKGFDHSNLFNECENYRTMAKQFLETLAKENPSKTHELFKKLYPKILEDLDNWECSVPLSSGVAKNQPEQFFSDHQIPENLPLYVKGLEGPRQEGISLLKRLDEVTGEDQALNDQIMQVATRPLVEALLLSSEIQEALLGIKGISRLELVLEECVQFLSVDKDNKQGDLTAFGKVVVKDQSNHEGQDEIARLTMTISLHLPSQKNVGGYVKFSAKPFHEMIVEFRKDEEWFLF